MASMRHGIHPHLEAEANRLLKESLKGTTKYSEKSDILTPWKENVRNRREIFNVTGVAEPRLRAGIYGRAANHDKPHLNSVPSGVAAPKPKGFRDSLSDHVEAQTPGVIDDMWR